MSRAGLSCQGCGSSNIVDDDLYCQAQLVCVDCGSVVSEGVLTNELYVGTDISYKKSTAVSKRSCANLINGLERVKEISRILRAPYHIEDLAQTYFKQTYQHENFIRVSLQKKEVLAGCCVLVSCRQMNWPITVGTIGCLLNADPTLVGVVHKEMVQILKIEAVTVDIFDVIESHCQEYKISSLEVPDEFAEKSKDLTKRATALVELAADSWIVTGRKPLPIMMAAIYLAWQSLNPNKHRLKFSLDKFCQLAKVQKHKPAITRITELKEVLCKLGRELPWIREKVTPNNVVKLVGDILEHRYALLRSALRTHEDSLQCQSSSVNPGETASSQTSEHVDQTANPSSVEQHCLSMTTEKQAVDGDVRPQSQKPNPNWGKRVLFAPPCVNRVNVKKRKAKQPVLDVTGDEEISDGEIDSYIRSPQEARDFAQMQKTEFSSKKV